jgi:hypothetical protein
MIQEGSMRFAGEFWPGVSVGLGLGMMIAPALVEMELLTPGHKVWAFFVGLILMGVGGGFRRRTRKREPITTTPT